MCGWGLKTVKVWFEKRSTKGSNKNCAFGAKKHPLYLMILCFFAFLGHISCKTRFLDYLFSKSRQHFLKIATPAILFSKFGLLVS